MLPRLLRLETLTLIESAPGGARFMTNAGPLEITFYAPDIVRMKFGVDDRVDYGLLVTLPEEVDVAVAERADGGYRLTAGRLALDVETAPLRFRLAQNGKVLFESTTDGHISGGWRVPPFGVGQEGWWAAFALSTGEPVYGLGEKWGALNKRGQLVKSLVLDALGVNREDSYKNTPFAWSPRGWGVFTHTTAIVNHGVGFGEWSHRSYAVQVMDSVMDLFLLAPPAAPTPDPASMIARYTDLTGRAPAIPRWSLGVWMSRCYYRTADELLDAARGLRERNIPCDVITLDGRAWLKVDTRFAFEWDAERYPDPKTVTDQLKELGFRLCVWEYPYVSIHAPLFPWLSEQGYLMKEADGQVLVRGWEQETFGPVLTPLPPSAGLDFTNPAAYRWWAEKHKELFQAGVDVIKTDFGEHIPLEAVAFNGETGRRLHNVYPLLYNKCVYEATEKWGPSGALVWGRAGWTGSQRYPMQWGGDPQGDWEGLAGSIRGGLSWGLSGVPFHTHDIGGFYDLLNARPSPEFFIRSTQVGVLSSHTRFHGQSAREPWEYGEEAERIVTEWIKFRYRLIPYLESCAAEASQTGLPVMRAMVLAFPDDPIAWTFEEQYMLGPALLVAPVLREGGHVRLYLPAGRWTDWWTGEQVEGPRVVETTVPLERIPLYGRAGCEVPLGPVVQRTDELPVPTPITEVKHFT
jgi:alpha-D-xyloside xylohydrolase